MGGARGSSRLPVNLNLKLRVQLEVQVAAQLLSHSRQGARLGRRQEMPGQEAQGSGNRALQVVVLENKSTASDTIKTECPLKPKAVTVARSKSHFRGCTGTVTRNGCCAVLTQASS